MTVIRSAIAHSTTIAAVFLYAAAATAQVSSERDRFLTWAEDALAPLSTFEPNQSISDLGVLREIVGDARIVALAEAVHAGAEPLLFRNRLFDFLVEEMGFTAIAIESGIVEGRLVHEYVAGGGGDLEDVLANGVGWTFHQFPQNGELIRWIREYNSRSDAVRKINYYGFDVPGSPGNHLASRGVRTALDEAMRYLGAVDPVAHQEFNERLSPLLPNFAVNFQTPDAPGYNHLSHLERDQLTAIIGDLIALMERSEAEYSSATSRADYEWGYRAAVGARQVDNWLRQIPVEWESADGLSFLSESHAVRDRAQIENLDWIIEREGPSGKVLVFASNFHVSAAPVATAAAGNRIPVMGTYARDRYGSDLVTIGNVVGQASIGCGGFQRTLDAPEENSIDAIARELGIRGFLLDLRTAPGDVAAWLDQEHVFASLTEIQVGRAFDVLLYFDSVRPAC